MTKAELIKALDGYKDDDEVFIGVEGFDEILEIEKVNEMYKKPVLLNELRLPSKYGLLTFANAVYEDEWNCKHSTLDELAAFEAWRQLI